MIFLKNNNHRITEPVIMEVKGEVTINRQQINTNTIVTITEDLKVNYNK